MEQFWNMMHKMKVTNNNMLYIYSFYKPSKTTNALNQGHR